MLRPKLLLQTALAMKHDEKLTSKVFEDLNKDEKILSEDEYIRIINANTLNRNTLRAKSNTVN